MASSIESGSAVSSREVAGPRDPYKSPTYPARVHYGERRDLEATLQSFEAKLNTVVQKLNVLGKNAKRAEYERTYFQLLGARDQVAECVRRIPLETASLYDEDKERFGEAVKAFNRIIKQWDTIA